MPRQYPKEFRERAVRLVTESLDEHDTQWSTIRQVATGLRGLMQVKGTPKVANPEGWLEGCSSCLTLIQVSSVATLSLSR
jgi:hypothetical protein